RTMEWADLSLTTMQISRTDLHRRCTESKGRHYSTRIGDPTRSDNGDLNGVDHLWYERHCADLRRNILREKHSPVPAGFKSLGDNCVAPLILQPARFFHRSSRGNNLCACPPNACHQPPVGKTEMEADDLRVKLDHEITHFFVE